MSVALTMIPSEQASILYTVKILMSVAGLIVFCLGAILYVYILVRDRADAAKHSRQDPDGLAQGRRG